MASHDSTDKFWMSPVLNFSCGDFICVVKNDDSFRHVDINSQDLSTSNVEGNGIYASCSIDNATITSSLPASRGSSEKNSSPVNLRKSVETPKECIKLWNNHPGLPNIKHRLDISRFDGLLLQCWDEANAAGALNYSVDEVVTKILPGKYGIVAQLNPARAVKRRKPQAFTKVDEPFNAQGFNFTKIKRQELLFNIHLTLISGERVEGSLIVNAAPICWSHSLLLPRVDSCLPQVSNREGLLLAVSAVLLSSLRSFRVGFNSLCAYASVNHHHYHCYYLPHRVYVEAAACRHIHAGCHAFTHHYAPGFVFQADPGNVIKCIDAVMKLLAWLVANEVPHNVFITRGLPLDAPALASRQPQLVTDFTCNEEASSEENLPETDRASSGEGSDGATTSSCSAEYSVVRVCVWARQSTTGAKDVTVFAPALCELAGHVPIYDPGEWDGLNEKKITDEIHSICEDAFNLVLSNIKNIL